MLKKLGSLCDALLLAVIAAQSRAREIKSDEQAMEVIQVVMLIAVGVIAIAAIWAGVNGLLREWWAAIMGARGIQDTSTGIPVP